MSEVTAKDLREVLESTKFYHWNKTQVTLSESKRLDYLAAFDAMAEKAEAFDTIARQFKRTADAKDVSVFLGHCDKGAEVEIEISTQYVATYYGATHIEALKAVLSEIS